MRKLVLLVLLGFTFAAQSQIRPDPLPAGIERVDRGWRMQTGDNPAYAQPGYDDRAWQSVNLSAVHRLQAGYTWFRLDLDVPATSNGLSFLIIGTQGVFETYMDGKRVPGTELLPLWAINGSSGHIVPIPQQDRRAVLAFRLFNPASAADADMTDAAVVFLGGTDAIARRDQVSRNHQLLRFLPSGAINLVIVIAGIGVLVLFGAQRTSREYFWLGTYLLLLGSSFGLLSASGTNVAPGWVNALFADPVIYVFTIAQIEFTYCFIRRRPNLVWRVYEALLLCCVPVAYLAWNGFINLSVYLGIESVAVMPAALALPVVLAYWYRRGNREAGLLIVPSLFPAAGVILTNISSIGIFFGLHSLGVLRDPLRLWDAVPIQDYDLADALFLLAIGVVIFSRFTKVNRAQARAAAELDAARQIQRALVPAVLPGVASCKLEAAYLPAEEVGGDFYQVIPQHGEATLIVVGDVSGKGLKAAMTGSLALGALRTLADENLSPSEVLERLNKQVWIGQEDGFITCICARITAEGTLTLANAGHLPPYRNGDEISFDSGLPLGVVAGAHYSGVTLQLEPGDTLTFLSDGVVEAQNAAGDLFGFERTREMSCLRADQIAEAAQQFGQSDDITVLTLQFSPAGALAEPATA